MEITIDIALQNLQISYGKKFNILLQICYVKHNFESISRSEEQCPLKLQYLKLQRP